MRLDNDMYVTAFDLAQRFIGVREIAGQMDNPQIMAMLRLDNSWPQHDEVGWCSAFANYVCWLLRLPRSKSLMARSWLGVGSAIEIGEAMPEYDVVVLNRAGGPQDPAVLEAPGHVGFYAGHSGGLVSVLGGNQGNAVSIAQFKAELILGLRRLYV